MEYCLSILYLAMDYLGFIWCLDAFSERKSNDGTFWSAFGFWIFVSFILFNFGLGGMSLWHTILSYMLFLSLALALYKNIRFIGLLLIVSIYHLVMYFTSIAVAGMTAAILGITIFEIQKTYFPLVAASIVNYLLMLFISASVKRLRSFKRIRSIHWKILLLTFLFPCSSFAILLILVSLNALSPMDSRLLSLCAMLLAIANIALFGLLDWIEHSQEIQKRQIVLTKTIQFQTQNMEALENAYSNQRKITHDFNAYIDTIANVLKGGDVESAIDFIEKLRVNQSDRLFIINTHHPIIDALLNQKAYVAKNHDIQIHFEVNDLSNLHIDAVDICAILGNLLDNAIEACIGCMYDKQITVKVLLGEKLFIAIRNTCNYVNIVGDHIATTKTNPQEHGFGLENIKSLLKKYDGEFAMEYERGWFTFTCEI